MRNIKEVIFFALRELRDVDVITHDDMRNILNLLNECLKKKTKKSVKEDEVLKQDHKIVKDYTGVKNV